MSIKNGNETDKLIYSKSKGIARLWYDIEDIMHAYRKDGNLSSFILCHQMLQVLSKIQFLLPEETNEYEGTEEDEARGWGFARGCNIDTLKIELQTSTQIMYIKICFIQRDREESKVSLRLYYDITLHEHRDGLPVIESFCTRRRNKIDSLFQRKIMPHLGLIK